MVSLSVRNAVFIERERGMTTVLDLFVTLTPPPPGADPGALASIALRCDALGLAHSGDLLTDPLTSQERQDLQWYLEEYWQWPYEGFLSRGKQIETLLPQVGKRLYNSLFGSREADRIAQKWLAQPETVATFQLSLLSELPATLSLPWELLHSEQGYLALRNRRPVSIVRRLPQSEFTSDLATTFTPPLRILLVTARPEGAGFVDPRSIARELLDALQGAIDAGTIALEFLRPATLSALQERLRDTKRPPIHILHFDGHGIFGDGRSAPQADPHLLQDGGQGMLAFETEEGTLDLVRAETLAQTLLDSGVQLAVLTACQSAMGSADDAFSSVAARLIRGGINAVSAMSASVLVVSAARYTKAFYRELATGASVSQAQERARQSLYTNPRRHTLSRTRSEEGVPVELQDWWLPHLYQQVPLLLQPTRKKGTRKKETSQETKPVLSTAMPAVPRYGFRGRSRELFQLERSLGQNKLVVIYGFGGMGKTALAREAADWLSRTGMYQGACFVSFEGGQGSTASLLSQLGFFLGVYDGFYTPNDPKTALSQLQAALKQRRILVIADNLESILPGGEAPLDPEMRIELWNVLLDLQQLGVGVLLTTRTTAFGDGRLAQGTQVTYLELQGLGSADAYQLASSLLTSLGINRRRAPYQQLRELLQMLGYHPLSIQLVLPALRTYGLAQIQQDFVALLPRFTDDAETGCNRSLLASLEYSLRRLSEQQRLLLPRLSVFEGGAMENDLLAITEIPEADWAELRPALEQAALLTAEQIVGVSVPFLHFHPVLIPFLRGQLGTQDEALEARYAQWYYRASNAYDWDDSCYPMQIRAIVQRELSNLRRAFGWLLGNGDLEQAAEMAMYIGRFLDYFGLRGEQQRIHQHIADALVARKQPDAGTLPQAAYLHEIHLGEDERRKGHVQAARARILRLLARIESVPSGNPHGHGSFEHVSTLGQLGQCLRDEGNFSEALQMFRRAIALIEVLVQHDTENQARLRQQAILLTYLGNVLFCQGQYAEARKAYEQALQIATRMGYQSNQAGLQGQLGTIALEQGDYPEARMRQQQALQTFHTLGEPAMEAVAWYQLGRVAEEEENWSEAERCYRESLLLFEQLGDRVGIAQSCNQLGVVARFAQRFAEAKGWFRRAVWLDRQADPTSGHHATSLSNLAACLLQEVQVRTVQDASLQLEEARGYAEQALAILQILRYPELWKTFALLTSIAEMQGRHEAAHAYRRKEKDAYISFAGHRYQIDQQFSELFPVLALAQNKLEIRAQIEESFPQIEARGWHISEAIERIWAGERDWQTLVENLDNREALFVLRVLETLGSGADTTTQAPSP
jgi:tetratricopeptide (TPR) repeat protein